MNIQILEINKTYVGNKILFSQKIDLFHLFGFITFYGMFNVLFLLALGIVSLIDGNISADILL